MSDNFSSGNFEVVKNNEGQYSIWPASKQIPMGWDAVGKIGSKEECISYISEVWTDMRPSSLRKSEETLRVA